MKVGQFNKELSDVQIGLTFNGRVVYGGLIKDIPDCIRNYEMKSVRWTSDNTVHACLEL